MRANRPAPVKPPAAPTERLATQLLALSRRMCTVAVQMDAAAQGRPEWRRHAQELAGAAVIAKSWAEGLRSDSHPKPA